MSVDELSDRVKTSFLTSERYKIYNRNFLQATIMTQSDVNPASFKLILSKLVKTPHDFSDTDIQLAINHVVTPGAALPEQVGAFLTGLAIARVELREDLLLAAASFVYSRSIPAIVNDADKHFIVDVVGTGGDGHNTFNVSTTAAIIAAGAGARVIKVTNPHLPISYHILYHILTTVNVL